MGLKIVKVIVKFVCFLTLLFPFPYEVVSSVPTSPDCIWHEARKSDFRNKTADIQCPNGYFRLTDSDFIPIEKGVVVSKGKSDIKISHTNDKFIGGEFSRSLRKDREEYLCCPGESSRIKDPNVFFWPNHDTISKALFVCQPTSIPGLDTIRFYLYTNHRKAHEIVIDDPTTVRSAGFHSDLPVKIIIHGFMSSPTRGPCNPLVKAFKRVKEFNLICIDWEALANLVTASNAICYTIAAASTKLVGARIALLIRFLVNHGFTNLNSIHILGHSLGAHCAGFAGKSVQEIFDGKVARITGFDPARPHFESVSSSDRLHWSDAHFVDVIHTATGDWKILGVLTFGLIPFPVSIKSPIGHVDFYPNGGTNQPGCWGIRSVWCSHSRAYHYYVESIINEDYLFLARRCSSLQEAESGTCGLEMRAEDRMVMGEYATSMNTSEGIIYYLKTNEDYPYAMHPAPSYFTHMWFHRRRNDK